MFASLDLVAPLCNFEKIVVLECVTFSAISTYNSDGQTLSRSNIGHTGSSRNALYNFVFEWYRMLLFYLFTFCSTVQFISYLRPFLLASWCYLVTKFLVICVPNKNGGAVRFWQYSSTTCKFIGVIYYIVFQ